MEAPDRIGKYEILSTLGRGGMGVVYRAQDPRMGRIVAIKTLTDGYSKDTGMLQRFYREAEKMGMLRHPNIITVYDLGEQDGFPYIVMEFVEGEPLDLLIHKSSLMPLPLKLRIIEQVCGALGYAHHHDVIHRDVKAANVIVRPDGVAKLLDFGIARHEKNNADLTLTVAGAVIGTVPYMAPERLKGETLDGRSDIFSTGVLLYQLLTGHLPFEGDEIVLVNKLLNDRPRPLSDYIKDYPGALHGIVDRALAKSPSDRYQTAEEMAADLYSVADVLKLEQSNQTLSQVAKLCAESDFVGARDALLQLLKLDSQHTRARRLLAEVNRNLTAKLRAEQAQQKRGEAEEAIRDRNYDRATQLLDEAASLVPHDTVLSEELEAVRAKKRKSDQILVHLRDAEEAKKGGDYASARAIVERALKLDTNDSRLRAAYLAIEKQAQEAAQLARFRSLLDSARKELIERKFAEALLLVQRAEEIGPPDSRLRDVREAAEQGLRQAERRRFICQIEAQLLGAVTYEGMQQVAAVVSGALERSPHDPTLLLYQGQLDGRMRDHELKLLVDSTVGDCLALLEKSPLQALESVRKALMQSPGDERLVALEASITDRIAKQTEEETRREIIEQARGALTQRRFGEAVAILERCKGTIRTPEITELLDYAREESEREHQQNLIAHCYEEAQRLRHEGQYEAVVDLLKPVLNGTDDSRLRRMLAEAETLIAKNRAEEDAVRALISELVSSECHEQVVAFIQTLPERLSSKDEIRSIGAASLKLWQEHWKQFELLGRNYAALTLPDPLRRLHQLTCNESGPCSGLLQGAKKAFEARRSALVDKALIAEMQGMSAVAMNGTQPPPSSFAVDPKLLEFAGEVVRAEWISVVSQLKPRKKSDQFLSRLGAKRK